MSIGIRQIFFTNFYWLLQMHSWFARRTNNPAHETWRLFFDNTPRDVTMLAAGIRIFVFSFLSRQIYRQNERSFIMARKGENIYKRKDGRWEGRYIKGRKPNGKALYGSVYGKK